MTQNGTRQTSVAPGVRPAWSAAAATALLVGCAVGPNFKPPAPPAAHGYVSGALPSTTSAAPGNGGVAQDFVNGLDIPGQWWTLFQSRELNALIDQALTHNPTLAAAQAALRQANENTAAQRGLYYPSISGSVGTQRDKASAAELGLPGSYLYSLNSASVNVSYTLDAFGANRRAVEALRSEADYERFALEAAYLSLTANIVTSAVSEASLRAQVAATEAIAHSQQLQLDIIQRRVAAGGASRVDLAQQQSTLASTLATLPPLKEQLAQQRNQLATYVGALPADYAGTEFSLDSLALPQQLPVSLPSKLVEQRPDVQQSTALLHQATAQIGVATANLLPQITLSGSYGGEAASMSKVFSPASVVWSLAASLTQPIFKGGQLVHQRRAAVAAAQEAAANYQATVLTAFQNVSNTLYALQADADALAAQTAAQHAAADSLSLVQAQYKSGAASYTQVLTSEQAYQSAEVALVKARAQRFADSAALFQSLGGGWWNRDDVNAKSIECCKGPQ